MTYTDSRSARDHGGVALHDGDHVVVRADTTIRSSSNNRWNGPSAKAGEAYIVQRSTVDSDGEVSLTDPLTGRSAWALPGALDRLLDEERPGKVLTTHPALDLFKAEEDDWSDAGRRQRPAWQVRPFAPTPLKVDARFRDVNARVRGLLDSELVSEREETETLAGLALATSRIVRARAILRGYYGEPGGNAALVEVALEELDDALDLLLGTPGEPGDQ